MVHIVMTYVAEVKDVLREISILIKLQKHTERSIAKPFCIQLFSDQHDGKMK